MFGQILLKSKQSNHNFDDFLNYPIKLNLKKIEYDMDARIEHDINTIHQYYKSLKKMLDSSVHVMLSSLQIQFHGIIRKSSKL